MITKDGHPFYPIGMNYVRKGTYKLTQEDEGWGDFEGGKTYPEGSPYDDLNARDLWLSKQIHDLIEMNVNTLGWACDLQKFQTPFCTNPNDPTQNWIYTSQEFWTSVDMKRHVNYYLANHYDKIEWFDEERHPHYYPYIVLINIIPQEQLVNGAEPPPDDAPVTWFDFLPDLWSVDFATKAYLRAFLMCADKDEVTFGDVSEDYPFGNDEQGNMMFPLSWDAHLPKAMCNEEALIFYEIGIELEWLWKEVPWEDRKRWLRKLVSEENTEGREVFAELMKEIYEHRFATPNLAIDGWNAYYGDTANFDPVPRLRPDGFYIASFTGPETPNLVDSTYSYNFTSEQLLLQFFDRKELIPADLGDYLRDDDQYSDVKPFVNAMADTFFHLATSAVREFDENHLIASCRFNDMPNDMILPVVKHAAEYCDLISFMRYLIKDGHRLDSLYKDLYDDMGDIPPPFVTGETTTCANWEKGYDLCCGGGDRDPADRSMAPCTDAPRDCPQKGGGEDDPYEPCPCCEDYENWGSHTWKQRENGELSARAVDYWEHIVYGDNFGNWIEDTESEDYERLYFNVGVLWFDHYDQDHSSKTHKPYCKEMGCGEKLGGCTINWGIKHIWDKNFIDGDWADIERHDWIPGPDGSEWGTMDSYYMSLTRAMEDVSFLIHNFWDRPPFSGKDSGLDVCDPPDYLFE